MTAPCRHCHGSGVEQPPLLGSAMRELRQQLGLGLRQVARASRVSPAHLSNLERETRPWSGPAAERVEALLRTTVEQRRDRDTSNVQAAHGGAA